MAEFLNFTADLSLLHVSFCACARSGQRRREVDRWTEPGTGKVWCCRLEPASNKHWLILKVFFSFFNIASDFKESIIRFHRRLMHENLPLLSQFWMATKAIVSKFKMYVLNLWESVRLFAAMTCVKLVFLPPESWRQMRHLIWTQGIKCGVYPLISADFFAK